MNGNTCPAWCNDHKEFGDLSYCQSLEREVQGHGLILVGPGIANDGSDYAQPAGLFLLPAVGDPLPEQPMSPPQARQAALLFRVQASRLAALADELEEAARLVETEAAP